MGLVLYVAGALVALLIVASGSKVANIGANYIFSAALGLLIGGLLAFGIMRAGHASYLYGKRLLAKQKSITAIATLSRGGVPPVLYLRSFVDDDIAADTPTAYNLRGVQLPRLSTEEEHLVKAIGDVGPFIAVADADEDLPHLGAARIPGHKHWKATVTALMSEAQLVIFRVGFGEGLWWEIEQALRLVNHQRLLFLIPNEQGVLDDFRRKLQPMLRAELPDLVGELQMTSTIGAILYFDSTDVPRLSPLIEPRFHGNASQPLFPMLRIALRPIYKQLEIEWLPPPIPRRTIAGIVLAGYGLGLSIYWIWEGKLWRLPLPRTLEFESVLLQSMAYLVVIVPLAIAFYYFFGGLFSIYFALREFKDTWK